MRYLLPIAIVTLFPALATAQTGWGADWVPSPSVTSKVRSISGALHACYVKHVPAKSREHGDIVTVKVVVSERGNVFRVDWLEGSTSSSAFKTCVRDLFTGLSFAPAAKTTFVQKLGFQNERASMLIEPPRAAGGAITKDSVVALANSRRGEIDACYKSQLASNPDLQGQVLIEVVVDPARGRVQSARTVKSTLDDPRTEQCVLGVVRSFAFPIPDERGLVIVQFPLTFQDDK